MSDSNDVIYETSTSATALAHVLQAETVDVEIDGRRLALAISVDLPEHQRRQRASAGALTSTGTLHGLWLLPSGGTVPATDVPTDKRDRFRSERGWVSEDPSGFQRLYSPAGIVTAAAVARARWTDALEVARALPPIFKRYVVVATPSVRLLADAHHVGVGVISTCDAPRVVAEATTPLRGRPAVYRWWLAEIAYEQWLQLNAQPVS